jgi:hypothetical protein
MIIAVAKCASQFAVPHCNHCGILNEMTNLSSDLMMKKNVGSGFLVLTNAVAI